MTSGRIEIAIMDDGTSHFLIRVYLDLGTSDYRFSLSVVAAAAWRWVLNMLNFYSGAAASNLNNTNYRHLYCADDYHNRGTYILYEYIRCLQYPDIKISCSPDTQHSMPLSAMPNK